MAWTTLMRLGPAALKLFKAGKKVKKTKRPKGKAVVKEEVSHLTDDQKTFIDRHRRKGKKQGEGGDWQSKKSLDGKQKITKQKKKTVDDLDSKESRKYEDLRKKQADQESLNQKEMERFYGKKKEGGWYEPKGRYSKKEIKKRIEPTKTMSPWKGNTPKARKRMEDWKPPKIEGVGPGPKPRKK